MVGKRNYFFQEQYTPLENGRRMEAAREKHFKRAGVVALFWLLLAVPGYGQISFQEQHGQQMRKSLKEAERADPAYKDTHLNTSAYTFRKGAAARKRLKQQKRASYQFNEQGKPVRRFPLFRKKKHKTPKIKRLLKKENTHI
ncbi:hypothetical protein [Pontibacter sp. CAU 1760]